MGTVAQNLQRLQNAKSAIASAITAKGGSVSSTDGFEAFPAAINGLPGDSDFVELVEGTLSEVNSTKITTVKPYVFAYVSTLTNVELPNCTTIGNYAFGHCVSLATLSISNCETIGSSAFYNCKELTSLNVPNCTTINEYAFYSCSKIESVYAEKCDIQNFALTFNRAAIKEIRLGTTDCNLGFCQSSPKLTTVILSQTSIIGSYAFISCASLNTISIPQCSTIGVSAFQQCNRLTTISLPKCNTISASAFRSCANLASIYLLNSDVCTLGNTNAFYSTPISGTGSGKIYVPSSLYQTYRRATNWITYASKFVSM